MLAILLAACQQGPLMLAAPETLVPMIESGQVRVTGTRSDIGSLRDVLDGDPRTLYRTPAINPAQVTVEFEEPRDVPGFRLMLRFKSRYRLSAASTVESLERAPEWAYEGETDDRGEAIVPLETLLGKPLRARAFRLEVNRLVGDDYVHIEDWQFARLVPATGLRIGTLPARPEYAESTIVPSGGVVRLRAFALGAGVEQDVTERVAWTTEGLSRWPEGGAEAWIAGRVERPETAIARVSVASLTAERAFAIEPWSRSNTRADLDVLFLEKTPRRNYDAPDRGNGPGWPADGEEIVWLAHVRSHHREARNVRWEAFLDGAPLGDGVIERIPSGGVVQIPLPVRWRQERSRLEFRILPPEWDANPNNNAVAVHTDALGVGFWIEEKLWDHWHDHQHRQNELNESFENWSQFMIGQWNEMMERAVHPEITPIGLTDRWRLDRVVVVPSGSLPLFGALPSNNPDTRDKTVDIAWGFNLEPDGVVSEYWSLRPEYTDPWKNGAAFLSDHALIHELLHARYISDSYGFDVHANSVKVELDGKAVVGSLLPTNFRRLNQFGGIMGAGLPMVIDIHTAGALERVKGRRARGGNMNAPIVIGEYLNDLSERNTMTFELPDGTPAAGAELLVWRAKPVPTAWFGKLFEGEPDLRFRLDAEGSAEVGKSPFGTLPLRHTFGHANTVLMMVVHHEGRSFVHFQEVTDFNVAFWRGEREHARHVVRLLEATGLRPLSGPRPPSGPELRRAKQ
jgi:hypothetical protein